MAIKTNTYTSYTVKGAREDLSDVISMISPTDTPFMTMIGKGEKVSNTLFEWQVDALDAVDTGNAQLEGEDYDSGTLQAATATTRMQNYVQISAKTLIVSGTNESMRKAGRKGELAYNLAKRSKELKRDMEAIMIGTNQAANAGAAGTARKTGSFLACVKTNDSLGATGASPVYTTLPNATRTDGTQRNFTEALLKATMQLCYSAGGKPTVLMLGPVNKQNASAFAGVAAQRYNAQGAKATTIIGAADIYVSDFGNLSVVPNRFQRERDAWLIDPEYAEMRMLRDFQTVDLAKTGDATKKLLLVEWGLQVTNEAAHGLVADLNTALI